MKQYLSIVFILMCFGSKAQNSGCIDSIESFTCNAPNLHAELSPAFITDNLDNAIFQIDTVNNTDFYPTIGFLKINSENQFIFRKTFSNQNLSEPFEFHLSFADSTNALIFSGGTKTSNIQRNGILNKIDDEGNMLWQKSYSETDNTDKDNLIRQAIQGSHNSIIALTYQFNFPNSVYRIFAIDSNGSIQWSKIYKNHNNAVVPIQNALISFNGNEIILAGQYLFDNNKVGLFLCRINALNGNIIDSKSFCFVNNENTFPYLHVLNQIQYNAQTNSTTLVMWTDERVYKGFTVIKFDSDFNIIKAKNFDLAVSNPYSNTALNKYNHVTYTYPLYQDTSVLYSIIDEDLHIAEQKKISLHYFPPFSNLAYNGMLLSRANDFTSLMVNSFGAPGGDNVSFIDGSLSYDSTNECLGIDSSFLIERDVAILSLTPVIDFSENIQMHGNPLPLSMPEDKPLQVVKICKQISICDTLKIAGPATKCLTDSFAHYSIYKNPLCRRKIKWEIDTSFIKIISSTDTSVDIKFLCAYRGFIKAAFEDCVLRDSIWLEIYSLKPAVNLGSDVNVCPGKTFLLNAGPGYKQYHWQDGSTGQTLNVSAPGMYTITVTDSCNNFSMDSILIKSINANLKIDYPGYLCLFDTAFIHIPTGYSSINWQPVNDAVLSNTTLKLFPTETTIFTIVADTIAGCHLSDTVQIKVNKCPTYIYFPTAFTPNNDGMNDSYKPVTSGLLTKYELAIYNRWGQLVFKTKNPRLGWNGVYNGGIPMQGSYVFICIYKFLNDIEKSQKGSFIIVK